MSESDPNEEGHYHEVLKDYKLTIEQALRFSTQSSSLYVKTRFAWASYVFTRICAIGVSTLKLAEVSEDATQPWALDHTSLCSLARNTLEASIVFCYLAERGIDEDEWLVRRDLIWLHDAIARHRTFKHLRKGADEKQHSSIIEERRSALSQHKTFRTMGEDRRAKLLSGGEFYLKGLRNAAAVAGWEKNDFDGTYTYLSQHGHSAPVSFLRMADHNIDYETPSAAQYAISSLAITVADRCVNHCCRNLAEIFPDKITDHGLDDLDYYIDSPFTSLPPGIAEK